MGAQSHAGLRGYRRLTPRPPPPPPCLHCLWFFWSGLPARLTRVYYGEVTAPQLGKKGKGQLGTWTHFDLVAVGPVGPIIQIIVGFDFFCEQLSGDEKKDGQGHEDFHAGFLGGVGRRD